MKSLNATRHHCAGWTLLECCIVLAVAVVSVALILPVAAKNNADARLAQCATHLNTLAKANIAYSADNTYFFFLDESGDDAARWWDRERVGQYVDGLEPIYRVSKRTDPNQDYGLGGGVMVCPADEHGLRSYDQNYWASPARAATPGSGDWYIGQRFVNFPDSDAGYPLDKLILFSEPQSYIPVSLDPQDDGGARQYATAGKFGAYYLPGERFIGPRGHQMIPGAAADLDRARGRIDRVIPWPITLDYGRHPNADADADEGPVLGGGVNIAFADGHVAYMTARDLADLETKRITGRALWSTADPRVERVFYGDDP